MPIIKAAIKALRQSEKRRAVNRSAKEQLREEFKEMKKLAVAKKFDEFKKRLPQAMRVIDKAAKNNLLHRNNAARKKSLLARLGTAAK